MIPQFSAWTTTELQARLEELLRLVGPSMGDRAAIQIIQAEIDRRGRLEGERAP